MKRLGRITYIYIWWKLIALHPTFKIVVRAPCLRPELALSRRATRSNTTAVSKWQSFVRLTSPKDEPARASYAVSPPILRRFVSQQKCPKGGRRVSVSGELLDEWSVRLRKREIPKCRAASRASSDLLHHPDSQISFDTNVLFCNCCYFVCIRVAVHHRGQVS
jgi:hypothetical protein